MKTFNIIEIDYDGDMGQVKEYQLEMLPRIGERIIFSKSGEEQKICKVLDIHHAPNEKTTIYVMNDYGSLKNILRNMANKMD